MVREGRRREFAHFAAFQDETKRLRIPDPNALSTFNASIPAPGDQAQVNLDLYRHLLGIRHRTVMPGIPGCVSAGAHALSPKAVQASWRLGNGALLTLATNLADTAVAFDKPDGEVIFNSSEVQHGQLPAYTTFAFVAGAK